MASFILRHLMGLDNNVGVGDDAVHDSASSTTLPFSPSLPCEKWSRKRTSVKIKNIGANHRANDVILNENMPQMIIARLDFVFQL